MRWERKRKEGKRRRKRKKRKNREEERREKVALTFTLRTKISEFMLHENCLGARF